VDAELQGTLVDVESFVVEHGLRIDHLGSTVAPELTCAA
jgi:hypothetical protein